MLQNKKGFYNDKLIICMDFKTLQEFGLTANEAAMFLILVKKGTLSVTQIAKETGLNRPYVYYALERLLEKGYISQIIFRGKKNFKSIDLDQIFSLEEHKMDMLKKLVSDLKMLKLKENENISVEVLKGRYVVKNIFKMCLSDIKRKEEIIYLGIDEEKMESIESLYLRKILNHFRDNKIKERMIIKEGGKILEYAKTTEYRFLNQDLIGNTAKIIYQDKVIELIYGDPIYAIVIKNKNLADTERKQFELFWKIAKK